MKNRIQKIISRIVATVSLVIIAFVFLPSFWFWVLFEFSALALVACGCIGEWHLHHHPAGRQKYEKDQRHKLESRFIFSIALGVTMELASLGHSIREGIKLEGEIAKANLQAEEAKKGAALANEGAAMKEASIANSTSKSNELSRALTELHVAELNGKNLLLQSNVIGLDKQVAEANIQLAKANERTALTESNNLVLRKEVVRLETQLGKIDPVNLPIVLATAEIAIFITGPNLLKLWYVVTKEPGDVWEKIESNIFWKPTQLRFKDT